MAIIKCKMCGGDLEIVEGSSVCECTYCGTKQTVPSADNEKKLTLFARAGRRLRACEFDKAAGVFETIVADFPEEAEAYWGLVLCKYGIEYVDDPATGKKIPTCHRSSFDSVMKDANFEQACENTDAVARRVYRDEARQIEELRKNIIEVSDKEEPYDVFISYKEKDQNGERTQDSVIAQEIYRELSREGYRVFFSRISLENRLGTEYEPYIFAALNSAKVMIVVGTDYENFDAVWVKNEWSRFLKLIAKGERKTLIPVFRNMDAYDMPEEFNKLTALDMGKVGAMQDLVHGVEKIVGKKKTETTPTSQPTYVSGGPNVTAILKRGQQALEDGEWDTARGFYDQVLSMDAENAEAFFGLFLAGEKCADENAYIERACAKKGEREYFYIPPATERINEAVDQYKVEDYLPEGALRAMFTYDLRYPSTVRHLKQIAEQEKARLQNDRTLNRAFRYAKGEAVTRLDAFRTRLFSSLEQNIADATERESVDRRKKEAEYKAFLDRAEAAAREKNEKAQEQKEKAYDSHCRRIAEAKTTDEFRAEITVLESCFPGYKDSAEQADRCREEIKKLKKEAAERMEAERQREEAEAKATAEEAERKRRAAAEETERQRILAEKAEEAKKKKNKTVFSIFAAIAVFALVVVLLVMKVVIPSGKYRHAAERESQGNLTEAAMLYGGSGSYKDSREKAEELWQKITKRETVAAGGSHTVGLCADGTVVAVGANLIYGQCVVSGWKNIVAVAAGESHTIGLRADGSVVAVGNNLCGQCVVSGWKNIVAVAAGKYHTVGLRADGTVVAAGYNINSQCAVSDWSDIVAVAAGETHTIGLCADGTVVAAGGNGDGQCNVSDWADIVAVAAGETHTVGLCADGTVVAAGDNGDGQCDISSWTDIVAIAAGESHTVGLRADGTVVAAGDNGDGQCDVSDWTDIVAIAAGESHTVGMRADGTVVAAGKSKNGQCDVSGWKELKLPEN